MLTLYFYTYISRYRFRFRVLKQKIKRLGSKTGFFGMVPVPVVYPPRKNLQNPTKTHRAQRTVPANLMRVTNTGLTYKRSDVFAAKRLGFLPFVVPIGKRVSPLNDFF